MNLVLKETSKEPDVRLIASIHGWALLAEYPASDSTPRQIRWDYQGDTAIVYLEDFLLDLNYLVVQGPREATVREQVFNGLEAYTSDDVFGLDSADVDAATAGTLIKVAALVAPRAFDEDFFALFVRALHHEALDVGRAAVFAVNYLPWTQLRQALLDLKERRPALSMDVDVVVRANDEHGCWISA